MYIKGKRKRNDKPNRIKVWHGCREKAYKEHCLRICGQI